MSASYQPWQPPYRSQAPWEIRARMQTGERLKELCQNRGDPRLSAWEEGFLVGMAALLWKHYGQPPLSEKQAAIVLRLEDKLRTPCVPEDC